MLLTVSSGARAVIASERVLQEGNARSNRLYQSQPSPTEAIFYCKLLIQDQRERQKSSNNEKHPKHTSSSKFQSNVWKSCPPTRLEEDAHSMIIKNSSITTTQQTDDHSTTRLIMKSDKNTALVSEKTVWVTLAHFALNPDIKLLIKVVAKWLNAILSCCLECRCEQVIWNNCLWLSSVFVLSFSVDKQVRLRKPPNHKIITCQPPSLQASSKAQQQ